MLCQMIFAVCWFNLKELKINRIASTPAFQIRFMEEQADLDAFNADTDGPINSWNWSDGTPISLC